MTLRAGTASLSRIGIAGFLMMIGCTTPSQDGTSNGVVDGADPAVVTVVAAGDIACVPGANPAPNTCQQALVGQLVQSLEPDAFLALGDIAYPDEEDGSVDVFAEAYDPAFGPLREVTHPIPGDAEWIDDRAAYFGYFGEAASPPSGYYSFDVGNWHLIALNSQDCFDDDGCGEGTEQYEWLQDDLTDSASDRCSLAYFHDPRFMWVTWWRAGEKPGGPVPEVAPFWELLYPAGIDVILGGNAHNYERWARQDPAGRAVVDGPIQFVVGTGGRNLNDRGPEPRPANLDAFQDDAFGALELNLGDGGFNYRWVSAASQPAFTDAGQDVECV